jgi:hypothetical protein
MAKLTTPIETVVPSENVAAVAFLLILHPVSIDAAIAPARQNAANFFLFMVPPQMSFFCLKGKHLPRFLICPLYYSAFYYNWQLFFIFLG